MRTSGTIAIRAIALEPLHHGAGVSGNTSLLRMQQIVLPDGRSARVPFISGNSIKHRLRYHAVRYALDILAVEDGAMTKAEIDLLFSGGHLSRSGAAIDLARARRMERLFPALSMCGYSAGNCMTESKLSVAHLHLVCAENAWRLPDDLKDSPMASLRSGALRAEEFGTRHDKGHSQDAIRLLSAGEVETRAKKSRAKLAGDADGKGDSAQMIYDFQVVMPGACFWGAVGFRDLSDLEMAALATAFHYATGETRGDRAVMHVGAKSSIGFGAIAVELRGQVRATAAEYRPSEALVGAESADRARLYGAHLREHRDEILSTIRESAT